MAEHLAVTELEAIEQRADPADIPRLVAAVRHLDALATERGDEVLRLSGLLDEAAAVLARRPTG